MTAKSKNQSPGRGTRKSIEQEVQLEILPGMNGTFRVSISGPGESVPSSYGEVYSLIVEAPVKRSPVNAVRKRD